MEPRRPHAGTLTPIYGSSFQRASFSAKRKRQPWKGDMRVAVMAAGAVGGYFGARIAAAGHDVAFIARGAHRDAIRQNGLTIESPLGDLHLNDVKVTDDPKQVGPVDVVLFAVKLWDTETAGEQTRPLVGSNTRLITLQNGVDSVERMLGTVRTAFDGEDALLDEGFEDRCCPPFVF